MGEFKKPLRRVVDLDIGEKMTVELANGESIPVQLQDTRERVDTLREAIREVRVKVRVRNQEVWLTSAGYHLPITVAGVQIDCPITKEYLRNANGNAWALEKDARLRLWPAGSPWIEPDSIVYPVRQRWFASNTQMANEPVFVDEANTSRDDIYYHYGLDIGGVEGMEEVISTTDGVVTAKHGDMVTVRDDLGWLHGYYHLKSIDVGVVVGERVKKRDPIGILGKEGWSGGWSHLHYEISTRQPSEKMGIEEGYAYLWQAYLQERNPAVIAVARPHHVLVPGEMTILDGSSSWAEEGPVSYEWVFSDGSITGGPRVEYTYSQGGVYSEILKVTNNRGAVDFDFAVVKVFDKERGKMPPGIHAAYTPTFGIQPGDPVTFAVRSFNTEETGEVWDFGDGTPTVTVHSVSVKPNGGNFLAPDGYALTTHHYARPGHYLVSVQHTESTGITSTAHLHVRVGKD